ncbi:MAG: YicC family protein [Myxococcales bacterium FL481]|nr:MAG: YicC family protein [Myxococcales bacterium FL481]
MPLRSMTGFGHAQTLWRDAHGVDTQRIRVEIRSLNARFCELKIRQPFGPAVERQIRTRIERDVGRGRVDVAIRCEGSGDDESSPVASVDRDRLGLVTRRLVEVRAALATAGLDPADDSPLEVLKFLSASAQPFDPAKIPTQAVLDALEPALDQFVAMRTTEGAALAEDILRHVDELAQMRERVIAMVAGDGARRAESLRRRVADLCQDAGASLDPTRLAQEVALLVARADVSEELTRLNAHIDQIRTVVAAEAASGQGKTLEFLVQELVREVTTLGSKVADVQANTLVIRAKGVVERLREQVQNVE